MKTIVIVGALLVLLGIIGFAMPVFTTEQNKEVAKFGDVQIQAKEETTHTIPPALSGGVLVLGIALIGIGAGAAIKHKQTL